MNLERLESEFNNGSKAEPKEVEKESPREKLLSFEREGKYVFHGSPDAIKTLEPRQAYDYNDETAKMEKDGEPAVFATPYADVAIFRALINIKDVFGKSTSGFSMDGEQLHFSATKNLLEQAEKKTGKVYILDKQKFKDFKGIQCRSEESIVPIGVVDVSVGDLSQNIEVITPET